MHILYDEDGNFLQTTLWGLWFLHSQFLPPKGAKVYPASRRRSNKRVELKGQLAPHCVPWLKKIYHGILKAVHQFRFKNVEQPLLLGSGGNQNLRPSCRTFHTPVGTLRLDAPALVWVRSKYDFLFRWYILVLKLLRQGCSSRKLQTTFRKLCGRHADFAHKFDTSVHICWRLCSPIVTYGFQLFWLNRGGCHMWGRTFHTPVGTIRLDAPALVWVRNPNDGNTLGWS